MKISVLIPTYRRVAFLRNCLDKIEAQARRPEQTIVVARDSDDQTLEFLASRRPSPGMEIVRVSQGGVVAAMNAGLAAATGDLIALTDDDTEPWPDWLSRIEAAMESHPRLAGVGGRDWVYHSGRLLEGSHPDVGRVQWFGRVVGNHHIGVGGPRRVDVLKGCNCAFRADLLKKIGFDTRLRGAGAQVHWELSLCLEIRAAGWELLFDPAIAVNHMTGERFDEDARHRFNALATSNAVYNETLILLDYLNGPRRLAFLTWALAVGPRGSFGLAQALRFAPSLRGGVLPRFKAALRGRYEGWRAWHAGPRRRPGAVGGRNPGAPVQSR